MDVTRLRDARTHNLRGVDLDLRPAELVVVAGVSGAGKSSLALDTLYAEGQRRFVESFSAYARQFLERRDRPPVGSLDPVPAAIAVDRGAPVRTSRSTVGTMTELTDYLRLLWSRVSTVVCDGCGREVQRGSVFRAANEVLATVGERERIVVTWRVSAEDPERYLGQRERLVEEGWRRVWLDGAAREIDEIAPSEALRRGGVDVVVDRMVLTEAERTRLVEALSTAMSKGRRTEVHFVDRGSVSRFSTGLECAYCEKVFPDPSPALFSFNSPMGACGNCRGFGRVIEIDLEKVFADPSKSLSDGAIKPWTGKATAWERKKLAAWCKANGVSMSVPWSALKESQRAAIIEGSEKFLGVRPWFQWLETKAYQMHVRVFLSRYRRYVACEACGGSRLRAEVGRYRVKGLSINDACAMAVSELAHHLGALPSVDEPTDRVVREVCSRLGYLGDVGVGYLSLDRASRTLSGGEVQRVALTAALGTSLTGTLMVLDEPTAGLHPRDAEKLVTVARGIASLGNVAVVIEHDLEVIAAADRVVELGPDAGENGGRIVFDGSPSELARCDTPTGEALRSVGPARTERRSAGSWLTLHRARGHNLKAVTLRVPLGVLTVVTGVSGSGKSSLVGETLFPAVTRALAARGLSVRAEETLAYDDLEGADALDAVSYVDQSALGRTTRGNPATYLKAWDRVRARFAALQSSKARGYSTRTFSFNVEGGRCASCEGAGRETVEMQFLADVSFECPDCHGRRFNDEVLEVTLREKNIADVLEMTADQAVEFFDDDPAFIRAIEPLRAVGLGYLRLGQSLSTLSGGEAQRLKLAAALTEVTHRTLVVLDEPTTGLHRRDVARVFDTLDSLVDRGVTVIVIEHDPWVAARADYVIDLGPEASHQGGELVAEGTPEEVSVSPKSRFAPYLRAALDRRRSVFAERAMKPRKPVDVTVPDGIVVRGAREHNLNVPALEVPREKLVAMTGPSGSGKSSLAFDVIYSEGQRRFLETLSPYARQYLPSLGRAEVDSIVGIPPAISLEQRTARAGAMSTVATVTEIAHYLRLLYARAATAYCPKCDVAIGARSPDEIASELIASFPSTALLSVWAPVVRARKGLHGEVFERARKAGIEAVRVDGKDYDPAKVPTLKKTVTHDVSLWLGAARAHERGAIVSLVRRATALAEGHCVIERDERTGRVGEPIVRSTRRACPKCGLGIPELDPRHFSFNTPQGRCEVCEGVGTVGEKVCGECEGTRLAAIPRAVRLAQWRFHEALAFTPGELRDGLHGVTLGAREKLIAEAPLAQLDARLGTLLELGLDYLTLDRRANTLSGGEMQRLRLAAQIGAGLTGALYVLDEPTIGLHGRDTDRLVGAMRALVNRGASVIVVEHDADVIRAADWVVDLGPAGGKGGGRVVASGPVREVLEGDGPTAMALREGGRGLGCNREVTDAQWLTVKGAKGYNLQRTTVRFPLGRFVCVAGVSGSGKSTLVEKVTLRAVRKKLGVATEEPLAHDGIDGWRNLKRAVAIDQTPIGRTPRSVPATYLGFWDDIRRLFAALPESKSRGWGIGRFSFNTTTESGGGRCELCQGNGVKHVEMAFLPDVVVPCEGCDGLRFSRETREVKLHGYDAGEVLALTVEEAREVFSQVPKVKRALDLLHELGLGYMTLGQGSHTLSGGEAQRIKLATELQTAGGAGLYVLDEPTTGLHLSDVSRLIGVLQKLVDRGDSLVVIEHHPDVLAASDWLIELGPGGGRLGGRIVAEGAPQAIIAAKTATAAVLERAQGDRVKPHAGREKKHSRQTETVASTR